MKIQITTELLDGIVLALLKQDDHYGYELTQQIQQIVDISESTMYPVLRRLKKEKYLETYDKPYQGRNRRYYRITESGRHELIRIQQLWQKYKKGLDEIIKPNDKEK